MSLPAHGVWPPAWDGPVAALAVALLWAGLFRLLRRPGLAALAPGIGLAAGWLLVLGLVLGSPRQLPERLPAPLLGGVLAGLALLLAGRMRGLAAGLVTGLAALGTAWWLAGGPLTQADLLRVAIPVAALLVLAAAALLGMAGAAQAAFAFALLAAGLWLGGPAGPWLVLALAGLAAGLGGLAASPGWGAAAALPVGLGLTGLVAGPVLARGAATDWTIAAAPLAALWIGPALAGRIGGRAGLLIGWVLAGGTPLLFTWLLQRMR
ncbi:hypothetical protein [Roseicella aerolata]|uniref:Uncharacterized protein n=1 Tax=Roseicella aerolata TaxID=2883479 RepID=A0A9X1IAX4_9PROT|nr:hypothetical protein [Roseicella aerolata]MCB4820469.1 hypothetical protein [Roseicella aerolata]